MMIATTKGRYHTRIIVLAIAGPLAVLFAYFDECTVYLTMFALMLFIGLALDTIWGRFIEYEPGWMTILFGAIEFAYIFTIIKLFELDVLFSYVEATFGEGLSFYLTAWGLAQLVLIYLLPIWRISWIEDGAEIW